MQTGYGVQLFDRRGTHFHQSFYLGEDGESLLGLRAKAKKIANEVGGIVVPLGILTDDEITAELQYMEADEKNKTH